VPTGNRIAIGRSSYVVAGADICVFASHSVSSRFRKSRLRVDPFVVRSCLGLELERIGNG